MPVLGFNFELTQLGPLAQATEPVQERPEDIEFATGKEQTTEEAKASFNGLDTYKRLLEEGYEAGKSIEEVKSEAIEAGVKQEDFAKAREFYLEQALFLDKPSVTATESKYVTNLRIANELVERQKESIALEKGSFRRGLNIADRLLRDVLPGVSTYEGLTEKDQELSREIQRAASTMSTEEFKVFFEEKINQASEEGIFASNTIGAQDRLQSAVNAGGFDPFTGLNKVLSVVDIAEFGLIFKGSKAAIKSTTALGRTSAIVGPEAAAKRGVQSVLKAPEGETLAGLGPRAVDPLPQPVRASVQPLTTETVKEGILKEVKHLYKTGAMGRTITKEQAETIAKVRADSYLSKTTKVVNDFWAEIDDLGKAISVVRLGVPKTGEAFKLTSKGNIPVSVTKLAAKVNGKVVPIDPNDLSKGVVVESRKPISQGETVTGLELDLGQQKDIVRKTLGLVVDNSVFGSSAIRDLDKLTTLSQLAEGSQAAVKEAIKGYLKNLNRVDSQERFTLGAVLSELRDGKDSVLRVRYTPEEFVQKYKEKHPQGVEPSENAKNAWASATGIEEADYVLKTHFAFDRAVSKGYDSSVEVSEGIWSPAKRVRKQDIKDDAKIIDGESSARLRLEDFADDTPFFRLMHLTADGQEYVAYPRAVRELSPEDTMGYNPGGSRINPQAKYFVVQGGERYKAVLSAFSEAEAKVALKQLKALKDAKKNGTLTDDFVKENNDFNPNLQTAEDVDSFVDFERGDFGYKERNQRVLGGEVNYNEFFEGMPIAEYTEHQMRRGDEVLTHFGGAKAYNDDPVNSILSQFGNSIFTFTNRAYSINAVKGWVETVKKDRPDWFTDPRIPASDYYSLFVNAKVNGTDEFARRMRELRNITMNRLAIRDDADQWMERLGSVARDFVLDKPTLKPVVANTSIRKAEDILLKAGFHSAMGFFNISQFVMQGFHAATISVMGLDPSAVAQALFLRHHHRITDIDARKLYTQRVAKYAGLPEEDFEELAEYIRTSGRSVVEGDQIEQGTGIDWGISGWNGEDLKYHTLQGMAYNTSKYGNKALDLGLIPFKHGERLSRLTAIVVAFKQFKKANPKVSALSDEGRYFITKKEQSLTLNMTTSSRAAFQQGLMKVPTQWLSFMFRAYEGVFVGRGLSAGERSRLFLMLAPFFGLSGFGMQNSADWIGEKLGLEPNGSAYYSLKYGAVDGLMTAMLGPESAVAFGNRLAPVGMILETYKKITEESLFSAALGPSGEITGGIVSSVWDTFGAALYGLTSGEGTPLTKEVIEVLRQPSALDNVAKAIGIWNNGVLRGKTGFTYETEMNVANGFGQLLGFAPLKAQEEMLRSNNAFSDSKKLAKFKREIQKEADYAFSLLEGSDEDLEKAKELLRHIGWKIDLSGFAPNEQWDLRQFVFNQGNSRWSTIIKNLIAKDNLFGLKAAERLKYGE